MTARLDAVEYLLNLIPEWLPGTQANQALELLVACWNTKLVVPERSTEVIASALESRSSTDYMKSNSMALISR